MSISNGRAAEGRTATLTVSVVPRAPRHSLVAYSVRAGSAAAGVDFAPIAGRLRFGAGRRSAKLSVHTLPDAIDEADETFTVLLSAPRGLRLRHARATVTIVDDDPPPAATSPPVTGPGVNPGQIGFVDPPPDAEQIDHFDPPSGSTRPTVFGVPRAMSPWRRHDVQAFLSADCSGPVAGWTSDSDFASGGIPITVPPGAATPVTVRSIDAQGRTSDCSAPLEYRSA